jgi:hypothetical protein
VTPCSTRGIRRAQGSNSYVVTLRRGQGTGVTKKTRAQSAWEVDAPGAPWGVALPSDAHAAPGQNVTVTQKRQNLVPKAIRRFLCPCPVIPSAYTVGG